MRKKEGFTPGMWEGSENVTLQLRGRRMSMTL